MQPNRDPSSQPRPWGRVSTLRLKTFSDGVFASAVTLQALQLKLPDLEGATTAGAVLHALAEQRRQFGFYAPTFLLTGGLLVTEVRLPDAAVWEWLVVGGRTAVRVWSARHRRRIALRRRTDDALHR